MLTLLKSSFRITTSADSLAAVEPCAPIAIPISAMVSEGASLTPSPTIIIGRSESGISFNAAILSPGRHSALTSVMPTSFAMVVATSF